MQDLHDLEVLMRSGVAVIAMETHDERRALQLLGRVSSTLERPLFHWTATRGLARQAEGFGPQAHTREPTEVLGQIKATEIGGTYVLADFHPFLDKALHVRYLKEIALDNARVPHTVVLLSHQVVIPPELEPFSARFEVSVPGKEELEQILIEQAKAWATRNPGAHVLTNRALVDRMVDNLSGLPEMDARRLARRAIEDDGTLSENDLPEVMKAKFDLLGRDGVLTFEMDTGPFADVGGLVKLKDWLERRAPVFSGAVNRPGLDVPKGVMLLGVQGCGKSLAAKAVAGTWGVPLLRLDFGAMYNKYFGESERNLRESLRQAELMSPCVLWIDEIEKGISTEGSDSGTSRRILGTLLTWMAENQARVFLVATANDIESLPPELLRKGRLDEIFFVDLPADDVRRQILAIHLRKRDLDPETFRLDELAVASAGFSGSEIEQAVVAGVYSALARETPIDTELLVEEMQATRPLSVVMAERIAGLRLWAAGRTVPAG